MKVYKEEQYFCQEFPKRLKYALKTYNMTEKMLAYEIGVACPTISSYVTGKRIPKTPVIVAMAKVFGCKLEWLACSELWEEDVK